MCAVVCGAFSVTAAASDSIISLFKNPDVDAKPMARMWFPDAGAGASREGLDMVAKQINDMAAGGFGGVEIAFLADDSSYDNDDAEEIGWGSENWRNVLKTILKTANAVEDGFKVDITITTHWPPTVNNIDPNDDEAAKEASCAYRKITATDIAAGKVDVPLPVQKTEDYFSPFGGGSDAKASFLFEDKLIAATIAKVANADPGGNPVFELATLQDVSVLTSRKIVAGTTGDSGYYYDADKDLYYDGYAAGIPDKAYCTEHGLNYSDTIADFGPEPEDATFEGKIDEDGNRKRMADWQFLYETDLSTLALTASEGNTLSEGDYVIFGSYYRGTGQVLSGGASIPVYNRCYAVDYFSDQAARKIFDFWDDHILDTEMTDLLKENGRKNGASIFEDSIEIHKSGPIWTYDLLEEFEAFNGYHADAYAPLLAMGSSGSFDDAATASRIIEDYNLVLGNLYATEHAAEISEWASGFNYTYRAQGYMLTGLDVCAAAMALDVPEGDNSTTGDGVRQLASVVSMKGDKMLSMESTTFSANIFSKWVDVVKELNADFSDGINRSILHGSAFARTFNGYLSAWPGWNFSNQLLNGGGFSSWNARQIYWKDVDTAAGYIARTQAVMQNGRGKVDLAVLLGTDRGFANQNGNSFRTLLNNGYSYQVMSEAVLTLANAVVTGGVLAADGPAYKALIVKDADKMSVAAMDKLIDYAQNGLPIILYNSNINQVYGTNKDGNNDTLVQKRAATLTAFASTARTKPELLTRLTEAGVQPAADYSVSGLETSHRVADEGRYYYFYNDNANRITPTVTMQGEGTLYILDAWTGDIVPKAQYSVGSGTVTFDLALEGKDAVIIALAAKTGEFPSVDAPYATDLTAGEAAYADGMLVHRAIKAGEYSVILSDTAIQTFTVDSVPGTVSLSNGWDLTLESWGPTEKGAALRLGTYENDYSVDPTLSKQAVILIEDLSLGTWSDLPVTGNQLSTLGVQSMAQVSGIGYYTTSFDLPGTWTSAMGASMQFEHQSDMIAEVTLNGHLIDDIDQFTDTVDVRAYLQAGTNELEIKLDTTLQNRASSSGNTTYGLTAVTLTPYVQTELGLEYASPWDGTPLEKNDDDSGEETGAVDDVESDVKGNEGGGVCFISILF